MPARILHLTSPLMRGADVTAAQRALTSNRFQNFDPGRVDGQYGPQTAAAIRRAKYWCGYAKSNIDGVCGPTIRAILEGRSLTATQAARRRVRLWMARRNDRAANILRIAAAEIGTKESPPDSNRVKYSAWYGLVGPWCAMFVSWVYTQAGRPLHYAYCPYLLADAQAGRNGLSIVTTPAPGDLVLFDWDRDGVPDHVGILKQRGTNSGLTTIEGNTSPTSDSNGGEVMERQRLASQVRAYIRVT